MEDYIECEYKSRKRDCDGDWDNYCHNWSNDCPYKEQVRDCDGDIIQLCRQ